MRHIPLTLQARSVGRQVGPKMIKFSLVVLFVMSLATLTVAASSLPAPPDIAQPASAVVLVATLG